MTNCMTLAMALKTLKVPLPPKTGPRTIPFEDIKRAYRVRAISSHPDRAHALGRDPQDLEEEFKIIQQSYRFLVQLLENQHQTREYPPAEPIFFKGKMPNRPLRFAEFLYYTGKTDWRTFIKALVWQQNNRLKTGEIAAHLGYLEPEQIHYIRRHSVILERFGEAARRLGKLNDHQIRVVLGHQKALGIPIGLYFTQNGFLSQETITLALQAFTLHNSRF